MLIEKNKSLNNVLKDKMILLTGAGGGIGLETAKAFVYMGANVTIAEINREKGLKAEQYLNDNFSGNLADFYEIDLADEEQVGAMAEYIVKKYGCPYAVFNNATITKMGAIDEVDISFWDKSYAVNLRAPLLLAQKFLPAMKELKCGVIVFVSSSGASPFMGAYEVFKTAQVELCNTLAMELENTNVRTFTIGPGLVKTETAMNAIKIVAASMGMSTDEFYAMNSQHILDVESAGVGFALSVLGAETYHGQEIGSIQVLMDYNLTKNEGNSEVKTTTTLNENTSEKMELYLLKILETFEEQYGGWRAMNIFERQWVLRDFKKTMGLSAEQALDKLKVANNNIHKGNFQLSFNEKVFLENLKEYWKHQLKLLQGYEKNKNKVNENTRIINGWILDIENVLKI